MKSPKSNRKAKVPKFRQEFPRGWNQKRVQAVIDHYDNLTDDELAAEIEAAESVPNQTMMWVPTELLAQNRRSHRSPRAAAGQQEIGR